MNVILAEDKIMEREIKTIMDNAEIISRGLFAKGLCDASGKQLNTALSRSIMADISEKWKNSSLRQKKARCAYYFSAEFMVGRSIFNNLLCLGMV